MADPYTSLARMDHSPSKSWIRKQFDAMTSGTGFSGHSIVKHASAAVQTVRAGGESVVVGSGLGAIHATVGLDQGPDKKVPIDGVVGAMGLLGGAFHHALSDDSRNIGAAGATVFSFRKTHDLIAAKRKASGKSIGSTTVHGEGGSDVGTDIGADEDPIVAAAVHL